MLENNPYATPKSAITPLNTEKIDYNENKWYHFSGRIGRLKLLAYGIWTFFITIAIAFIVSTALTFILPLGKALDIASIILAIIIYVPPIIFVWVIYPIRQLNDLGKTGWLVLMMLIPIVNVVFYLYLLFAKGDPKENKYGTPPLPNQWYHWFFWFGIPIVFVIFLFVIDIPAYQDASESFNTRYHLDKKYENFNIK